VYQTVLPPPASQLRVGSPPSEVAAEVSTSSLNGSPAMVVASSQSSFAAAGTLTLDWSLKNQEKPVFM
jgi:hypothetical protein